MRTAALLAATASLLAIASPAQSFVVANRGSGDITVFDRNGNVEQTVPLTGGALPAEPMYVVQVDDEVVVGDRANNRIVRFAKSDYQMLGSVPVGNGVFHMWTNGNQIWVNNDIDNTSSVVDTATWSVVQTVPMPADLVADGYKPHDVFVTHDAAYVSLLGGSGADDFIVRFDTDTFAETHRAEVGQDPHVWYDPWTRKLMVASQGGNAVQVLRGSNLHAGQTVASPGAHGIYMPRWTRTLLVTNISGGGTDGLRTLRVGFGGHLSPGDEINTPEPTPHNIAASTFGRRIFVTHSGATATKVSIYRLRGPFWNRQLRLLRTVDAGTNPFGLAVVR